MRYARIFWGMSAVLALAGCVKNSYKLDPDTLLVNGNIESSFAIPIGAIEATVADALVVLDSNGIQSETLAGGGLALVESFEILDTTAANLLQFSPVVLSESLTLPVDIPPGLTYSADLAFDFPIPSGMILDSLEVAEGILQIQPEGDFPADALISIDFADWHSASGVPFAFAIGASAESFGLSGQRWSPQTSGTLHVALSIEAPVSGFAAGSEIGVNFSFDLTEIQWVVGQLPDYELGTFEHTVPFAALDGLDPGVVHLSNPSIELEAVNGTGWSIQPLIDAASYTTVVGPAFLGGPALTDIPVIQGATGFPSVTPSNWAHVLDNSGMSPTMTEVFEASPEDLTLTGRLVVPADDAAGFLTQGAPIRLAGRLVIPLEGWVNGFGLRDTIALDLDQIFDENFEGRISWKDVEEIRIRSIWNNGLPVGISPQMTFQDSSGTELLTWYEDSSFEWMPANSTDLIDWVIDDARLAELENLRPALLEISGLMSTPGAPDETVEIASDAVLGVRLGLEVKLNVDLNE